MCVCVTQQAFYRTYGLTSWIMMLNVEQKRYSYTESISIEIDVKFFLQLRMYTSITVCLFEEFSFRIYILSAQVHYRSWSNVGIYRLCRQLFGSLFVLTLAMQQSK